MSSTLLEGLTSDLRLWWPRKHSVRIQSAIGICSFPFPVSHSAIRTPRSFPGFLSAMGRTRRGELS